eukprot:364596-Pyramimonas_sp.AAC.1
MTCGTREQGCLLVGLLPMCLCCRAPFSSNSFWPQSQRVLMKSVREAAESAVRLAWPGQQQH